MQRSFASVLATVLRDKLRVRMVDFEFEFGIIIVLVQHMYYYLNTTISTCMVPLSCRLPTSGSSMVLKSFLCIRFKYNLILHDFAQSLPNIALSGNRVWQLTELISESSATR